MTFFIQSPFRGICTYPSSCIPPPFPASERQCLLSHGFFFFLKVPFSKKANQCLFQLVQLPVSHSSLSTQSLPWGHLNREPKKQKDYNQCTAKYIILGLRSLYSFDQPPTLTSLCALRLPCQIMCLLELWQNVESLKKKNQSLNLWVCILL